MKLATRLTWDAFSRIMNMRDYTCLGGVIAVTS